MKKKKNFIMPTAYVKGNLVVQYQCPIAKKMTSFKPLKRNIDLEYYPIHDEELLLVDIEICPSCEQKHTFQLMLRR